MVMASGFRGEGGGGCLLLLQASVYHVKNVQNANALHNNTGKTYIIFHFKR